MEDESSVAQGLEMILREQGYGVDLAMTGQGALDTLSGKGFDLLVADLRLPDMDGMEVIKRVKSESPDTEVVVITGYAEVSSAVHAMRGGAADYLPKPFTEEAFMTAVDEALSENRKLLGQENIETAEAGEKKLIQKNELVRALKKVSKNDRAFLPGISWAEVRYPNRGGHATPVQERLEQKPEDQAGLLQQHKLISLGRLAASVVHEINNPLAGILNYLGLIIKILGRESPLDAEDLTKFERYLDLVESEVRRCSIIMSNLLAFSRKSNLEFSEVDIDELLERCIILSQHKLDLQNIEIRKRIDSEVPKVWGDFNQIQQCVINLIFNAIDAMPDGGRLTLESSFHRDKGIVRTKVQDTGYGIPKEHLTHIFDPFYTTKGKEEGFGLGLSTVHGIIERHKGSINLETEEGKGTIFTIDLPAAKMGIFSPSYQCPSTFASSDKGSFPSR